MTYPPQQPGPYGQQPQQPGGFGNQPQQPGGQFPPTSQFPQQGGYQGLGGFPGGGGQPPKQKNTGKIVAIVIIAVLVLGGAGVGVYFLTKDSKNGAGGGGSTTTTSAPKTTGKKSATDEPTTTTKAAPDTSGPQEVVENYLKAYESKSFSSVTGNACDAYKDKYGTDTTALEKELEPFDITATAQGEPTVSGSSATALIDLVLSKDGTSKDASIKIKIVKESGEWRFCGEEEA
ncbi:hypothetical protein [Actinokineospora globicatena]|uniref:DUF4878 domain-containing protein n=1 Tax=Actinokineospora globicatena TaxID=103729 RepID=A0A9W6QUW8_9PSEU|nr:hypothetical protein [Actinokineospora globicatena]MCP2306636.1 hypothetical protein [Actinokineospora globicatena]GLW82248.1 hypothetical protein Aglo01_67290 [Actinokineospora globicatena]GLW89040.1 hypothetical protein Aglo02_66790 [Actinokineospora globicatena]GLW95034.1 hypothetical protein Aglo03_58500 [Actinokineospora globicatena]